MRTSKISLAPTAVALAVAALVSPMAAMAQNAADDSLKLDKVIITASPEGRTKMKQSQSVSTVDAEQILQSPPNSAAELLRQVPGVRAEASSGDGNANITVRGVPISAGGSRYVQIQEDGLPVLLFGDFDFVTADMFTRVDYGTQGLEVVRGGGASTLASSSPGGVINFRSKTGDVKSRTIGFSLGSNSTLRTDFEMGDSINERTRFHVSGYVRNGEGPRDTGGVKMEKGFQLRGNLTRDLGGGDFVRINAKFLDDQSPTLLTVPIVRTGTTIAAAPGIDPRTFTPHRPGLFDIKNFGFYDGGTYNPNEGLKVKSLALGTELQLSLGNGWRLNNNFRFAQNSGMFLGYMPHTDITAPYKAYTSILLGAKLNDLNAIFNDLKLSKSYALAQGAKLNTTAGLFLGSQRYNTDWEIAPVSQQVNGPQLVNDYGKANAQNWRYQRSVNMTFNQLAPYLALGYEAGPLNIDASVRVDGHKANGSMADGPTANSMNYKSSHTSFSLGANYSVSKDMAVFGRVSSGAAFWSDRVTSKMSAACGAVCLMNKDIPVNTVKQYEFGTKYRSGKFNAAATYFIAKTDESNYDLTTGKSSANTYDAKGVELEASYSAGIFRMNGGLTLTDANVTASSDKAYVGKSPNRQAKLTYQLSPSIKLGKLNAGAQIIATGSSRDAQGTTYEVVLPGYSYVNLYANYDVMQNLNLGLAINNAFNKIGFTEMNNERNAARSINGRTFKLMARYSF